LYYYSDPYSVEKPIPFGAGTVQQKLVSLSNTIVLISECKQDKLSAACKDPTVWALTSEGFVEATQLLVP
jgi:hypothetical protein